MSRCNIKRRFKKWKGNYYYLWWMHCMVSHIIFPKMLKKCENCTIKPLFAYFTISLSIRKVYKACFSIPLKMLQELLWRKIKLNKLKSLTEDFEVLSNIFPYRSSRKCSTKRRAGVEQYISFFFLYLNNNTIDKMENWSKRANTQ